MHARVAQAQQIKVEQIQPQYREQQIQPEDIIQPAAQAQPEAEEVIERPIVDEVLEIDDRLEPVAVIIYEPARVAGNVNITIALTGSINFDEDVRFDAATGNPFLGVISEFLDIPRITGNIQRHEHIIIGEPCISVQYLKYDNERIVRTKY